MANSTLHQPSYGQLHQSSTVDLSNYNNPLLVYSSVTPKPTSGELDRATEEQIRSKTQHY